MTVTDHDTAGSTVPLVVDVDGTLLRSDLLIESALELIRQAPWKVFCLPLWLAGGKAHLKRRIAQAVDLPMDTLPLNRALVERLKLEKSAGRPLYLASAADHALVESLADHLSLFDGIFASAGRANNAGAAKAAVLVEAFGERGFDYAANGAVDVHVWKQARRAMLVNTSAGVRRRVEAHGRPIEVIASTGPSIGSYLKALRPQQWLKNLLVFVPLLAAHSLDFQPWLAAVLAFATFSLGASAVYIFNDLIDLPHDRAHPRKRHRPFASGELPVIHGIVLAPLLVGASLVVAGLVGWQLLAALLAYLTLTTLYSLALKRLALVDVFTLATLYTTRMVAGALAAGIVLSEWLMAFSIFLFLALAIVKRYAELADARADARGDPGGRGYQLEDLNMLGGLGAASAYSAVVVLALYINSDQVHALYSRPGLLWGICALLLFWISRMLLLSHRGCMHDDPLVFAIRDPLSLVVAVLAGVLFLISV